MQLTNGEKLILSMLADIHKALKIKNRADPDLVSYAIETGNTWGIEWQYPGIFGATEVPESEVNEVCDVLEMWTRLEEGYAALTKPAQTQVLNSTKKAAIRFAGFDGNNEGNYISIARMLTEHLDRFTLFKGRDLNSHSPSIGTYRRMLGTYRPIRPSLAGRELTASEIVSILT